LVQSLKKKNIAQVLEPSITATVIEETVAHELRNVEQIQESTEVLQVPQSEQASSDNESKKTKGSTAKKSKH